MPLPGSSNFWRSVDMSGDCWIWTRSTVGDLKYGKFYINGVTWRAHRYAYTVYYGTILNGLQVRHLCDNPSCVRPGHLALGTHEDNMRDRDSQGRGVNPVGEHHGQHKLTERGVMVARRYFIANGCRPRCLAILARELKVGESTIADAVRGKTWRHLPMPTRIEAEGAEVVEGEY